MPKSFTVPLSINSLSLDQLQSATVDALVTGLNGLVEGAAGDVQLFATEISVDLIEAAALGRQDLVDALIAQLEVVGEINRVRFVTGLVSTARNVVLALVGFLAKAVVPTPAVA